MFVRCARAGLEESLMLMRAEGSEDSFMQIKTESSASMQSALHGLEMQ